MHPRFFAELQRHHRGGCETIYKTLRSFVGPTGTIIVPTFTYSYRRNEVFDVSRSVSINGVFSEYIRKLDGVTVMMIHWYHLQALVRT